MRTATLARPDWDYSWLRSRVVGGVDVSVMARAPSASGRAYSRSPSPASPLPELTNEHDVEPAGHISRLSSISCAEYVPAP